MKWTKTQEDKLRKLCFEEKTNAEIAKALGIDVKEVHAARSRLGITIPKVKAAKAEAVPKKTAAKKLTIPTSNNSPRSSVKASFKNLQDALLLAVASDWTDERDTDIYANTSKLMSALEDLCFGSLNK